MKAITGYLLECGFKMPAHITTMRIPEKLMESVSLISRVERVSINEIIRRALVMYVKHCLANPTFIKHLHESIERDKAFLEEKK